MLLFLFWCSIYSQLEPTMGVAVILTATCVLFSVITYYTTAYFFVPVFIYKKKYIALAAVFILFLIVTGSLNAYAEYEIYEIMVGHLTWNYVKLIYNVYIQLFYIAAIAGCIKFFRDKYNADKSLERIEKENAQNELKFLKAQMNPHFMFNSLNTIYFQIPKESQQARNTLLTFSNLLRYQLYECNVDKISIYKEINYISGFVELQRKRRKSTYHFDLDFSEIKENFEIAPLIIIPFVENAFKHVSAHKNEKNIVHIKLSWSGNSFQLRVTNSKDCFKKDNVVETSGIGLENIKRRLELLYPARFVLNITQDKAQYTTELKINL